MFVYTAKLNRKKIYVAVIAVFILVLAAFFVIAVNDAGSVESLSVSATVKTNDQRIEYLNNLGWEVHETPIDEQTIIIPENFSAVYEEYNKIQLKQGFDLTKFAGKEAQRFTYKVLNYPGTSESVVADIIVYRGRVIAGDVQSTMLDGFMDTLDYPEIK